MGGVREGWNGYGCGEKGDRICVRRRGEERRKEKKHE